MNLQTNSNNEISKELLKEVKDYSAVVYTFVDKLGRFLVKIQCLQNHDNSIKKINYDYGRIIFSKESIQASGIHNLLSRINDKECVNYFQNNPELREMKNELDREKRVSLDLEQHQKGFKLIVSEYHEAEKIFSRIYYLIVKINQYYNEINILEQRILKSSSRPLNGYTGMVNPEYDKIQDDKINSNKISIHFQRKLELAKTIDDSLKKINQLLPTYKKSSKNSGLLRIKLWNVYVFILFTHYVNFYSVMRWPFIIRDNSMRNNLNALLYEKILDIHQLLNKHQSPNETISKIIFYLIKGEQFRSFMNINEQKYYQMIVDYQAFGLDEQIKQILRSIITVDEYENKKLESLDEYLQEKKNFCNNYLK